MILFKRTTNITLRYPKQPFTPAGGGQPSDRGTIDGIAVEDVYERDGSIYHVLGSWPQGKSVVCRLDFNRRFDLMQQHTGQHLLSAVLFRLYECKTSSLHMGMDELSIDVSLSEMPAQMITAVEDAVNNYIFQDLPVSTHVMTPQEAGESGLKKNAPEGGRDTYRRYRVYRPIAHAAALMFAGPGEIGMIKIVKTEKRGAETRVYFKCGKRALKDYQSKQDIVSGFVRLYRMSESEVLSKDRSTGRAIEKYPKRAGRTKGKAPGHRSKRDDSGSGVAV